MKRYLGNTHKREVHDTWYPNPNCQLNEIKPEHKRWFDSVAEAKLAGFDPCYWCLQGSTR